MRALRPCGRINNVLCEAFFVKSCLANAGLTEIAPMAYCCSLVKAFAGLCLCFRLIIAVALQEKLAKCPRHYSSSIVSLSGNAQTNETDHHPKLLQFGFTETKSEKSITDDEDLTSAAKIEKSITDNFIDRNNYDAFEIDAVITYVNGSEPNFLERKLRFLEVHNKGNSTKVNLPPFSATPNRFMDNGDLKFLLRSIEEYGTMFRQIHVVVADVHQIPRWLNTNHPRIRIVYHLDIWKIPAELPVFNSWAIEANIHRIKGLAETFVYFNDDMLLLRKLQLSDYVILDREDLTRISSLVLRSSGIWPASTSASPGDAHYIGPGIVTYNASRTICHGKMRTGEGLIPNHTPNLALKSVLFAAEAHPVFAPLFARTSASRFRTGLELNAIMAFNGFAQCAFNLTSIWAKEEELLFLQLSTDLNGPMVLARKLADLEWCKRKVKSEQVKFLCINDDSHAGIVTESGETFATSVYRWRESLFPTASMFEVY